MLRFQQDGQVRGRRNDGALFQIPQSGRMTALVRPLVAISAGLALTVVVASASSAADESKPATRSKPTAKAEAVIREVKLPEKIYSTGYTGSAEELIGFINESIRQGWKENNVGPSDIADDAEWMRRVHLDLLGHIPEAQDVEKFLADKDKAKRSKLIDQLLDNPAYVRNFTTIWSNLLIGRQPPREVSRKGLQKFLRESFAKNKGWDKIVYDLVSAEGHFEENGAANFLLAHLNDGAVPATAITARLFLGRQVQCTQCHNHPFNDWKQEQFWELNSFFKQASRKEVEKYNERTGRMDFDHSILEKEIEGTPAELHFEKRNGLMQVAYPTFNGTKVEMPDVDRLKELARMMTTGDKPQIAEAMVNRMWGHFMGYGFTKPVDDMGPHNAASHPALLERLSAEFVKSGYDIKQLIRWITNSEPYNLTTRFGESNKKDNPAGGETPMFSRVYLKSMNAEQLYDSLIIATNAHKSGQSSWEQSESKRQEWLQQFVIAFGTDENDEATTFDGTIPQALMMMNGELVRSALSGQKGSTLGDILNDPRGKEGDKVRRLYHATLGRNPSTREAAAAKKLLGQSKSLVEGYQDIFWALLNSNEFIFNH